MENEIILFQCPKIPDTIKLKLTEKACAKQYIYAMKLPNGFEDRSSRVLFYCKDCEIGAKNSNKYGKKLPKFKKQIKTCILYSVAPDKCKTNKHNGIFTRKKEDLGATWFIRKYCCPECGVIYNKLKEQGLLK